MNSAYCMFRLCTSWRYWLHGPSGADDLLVPLAPAPRDVPTGRPVPAGEIITKLTELAQRLPAEAPNEAKGS